jgi:glycerol kinase
MVKAKYILALDQGTTSSRALIIDRHGNIGAVAQKEFPQIFPQSGWVEHDPNQIWSSQAGVAAEALAKMNLDGSQIAAIGISNQRETAVVWDRRTGEPIYNAIVWQDRRTSAFCDELKQAGLAEKIRRKTGLVLDAYFSATKVRWILDHVPGVRQRAQAGELAFGTIDSWLVWKLTQGRVHVTDISNASRTLLFNIHEQKWDEELCKIFEVPAAMLPVVKSCSEVMGVTGAAFAVPGIPIAGMAGDQQAALFGNMCTEEGMIKNTYGTGCFLIMNTGARAKDSKNNLLTTIAWKLGEMASSASPAPGTSKPSPRRSRITAASTSSRPSPDWGPPTGTSTPAARSSASPAARPTPTSPGPVSNRSPFKRRTSWTPWPMTPACRSPSCAWMVAPP